MNRLLTSILYFAILLPHWAEANQNRVELPQYINGELVVESNDAGEVITVNEEEYAALTGQKYLEHLVSFFNFKMSWETVASYITPTLESQFDVFIIINVDASSRQNMNDEIPSQFMKVIQRTQAGQKLFVRSGGRVVGIRKDVYGNNGQPAFPNTITALNGKQINGFGVMSDLIPVSSGAGHLPPDPQPHVDTPTGIYRINFAKSNGKRYSRGMWHSLYFDLVYPSGRTSSLAVHGTSTNKYSLLGRRQDSHGCVRIRKVVANLMYENLINSGYFWADQLPDMNNRLRLKAENGRSKPGARALIVLFYGYNKSVEHRDL